MDLEPVTVNIRDSLRVPRVSYLCSFPANGVLGRKRVFLFLPLAIIFHKISGEYKCYQIARSSRNLRRVQELDLEDSSTIPFKSHLKEASKCRCYLFSCTERFRHTGNNLVRGLVRGMKERPIEKFSLGADNCRSKERRRKQSPLHQPRRASSRAKRVHYASPCRP